MPLPLTLLLILQAPVPLRIEARTLQAVPGPLVPEKREAGQRMGSSELSLALRRTARRSGTVPAVALPPGPLMVEDRMDNFPAGWKAYRAEVAPKAAVHVRLRGLHEAWFRVSCVNRWGALEAGMLQNRISTGNPEASFRNPKAEVVTVWFIVDLSDLEARMEAYTLEVTPLP